MSIFDMARAHAYRTARRNLRSMAAHLADHDRYGLTYDTCPICHTTGPGAGIYPPYLKAED